MLITTNFLRTLTPDLSSVELRHGLHGYLQGHIAYLPACNYWTCWIERRGVDGKGRATSTLYAIDDTPMLWVHAWANVNGRLVQRVGRGWRVSGEGRNWTSDHQAKADSRRDCEIPIDAMHEVKARVEVPVTPETILAQAAVKAEYAAIKAEKQLARSFSERML